MLKKVEKQYTDIFGLQKVDDYSFTKPCFLTILPSMASYREMSGYLGNLLYLLQVRSSKVKDSDYSLKDIPFDLISVEYKDKLADMIMRMVPAGNILEAKKVLRNINIFSYCAGNDKTSKLLHNIYNSLKDKGYQEDEIKDIMSEIFVIEIIDNNREEDNICSYATPIVIQDIYDIEENDEHVEDFNSDNPFISSMYINGIRYYLYKSFGEGSLSQGVREHNFKRDYAESPVLNSVMALNIIKAIEASLNDIPKKNVSIYHELQEVIHLAEAYVASKNKDIDDLTQEEKDELNSILFKYIRTVYKNCIPTEESSLEEINYLNERDDVTKRLFDLNGLFFEEYKNCLDLIDRILDTYRNHSFGEIVESRVSGNIPQKIVFTREMKIIEDIRLLESKLNYISNIEYPENISPRVKADLDEMINGFLEAIRSKTSSEEFQRMLDEIYHDDTDLKIKSQSQEM